MHVRAARAEMAGQDVFDAPQNLQHVKAARIRRSLWPLGCIEALPKVNPAEAVLKAFFIHRLFNAGLALKGVNAAIECFCGLLLAATNAAHIQSFIDAVTQSEMLHDHRDAVAAALLHASSEFSVSTQHFYAVYLLGHGVLKLIMVFGLARKKMWAYPFALTALLGFIFYQTYRVSYTHSLGLTLLTAFDCAFMLLVWQEYGMARRRIAAAG
jgi:uncharacterized membrane protein